MDSSNVVSNSDYSRMKLAFSFYFDNISYHSYLSPKQDLKTNTKEWVLKGFVKELQFMSWNHLVQYCTYLPQDISHNDMMKLSIFKCQDVIVWNGNLVLTLRHKYILVFEIRLGTFFCLLSLAVPSTMFFIPYRNHWTL